jgi:hypothetical protein
MPALRGDRVQLAQQNEVCVLTAAGPFSARIIVDATVRASWLSRRLGIARGARSPWLIARYGYAAGFCSGLDEAPELVGDSKGSVWAAMVQPGLYHSTRVASDGFRPHQSWVPANLHRLTPVGSSRGADVTWRMVAHTEHPAWFIVGDAACLLDPRIALRLRRSFISTGCPSGLRWRPSVLRHSISHFPRRQRDPPAPKRFTTISSAEDILRSAPPLPARRPESRSQSEPRPAALRFSRRRIALVQSSSVSRLPTETQVRAAIAEALLAVGHLIAAVSGRS